ncbi:hypothetical protein FBUS_11352 [Fasciolopsis buskii]|uniref:Uncharacterized protein n=1 Tax=Fasciolopsis buskii TaxID=27845 RepID=A0A8E0S5L2_9TREM|nr:hypothetical protein FBUS_11352 [Fasciolopsis buski]
MMQNTDLSLRPMTPSNLPVTRSLQQQQGPQGTSCSIHSWMPPPSGMPMGHSFAAYLQPTPYSPMVWNGQQQQQPMVPACYPHQIGAFLGPSLSMPNPQQPIQSVAPRFCSSNSADLYSRTPDGQCFIKYTNSASYRVLSPRILYIAPNSSHITSGWCDPNSCISILRVTRPMASRMMTAWVEEANVVTGATSETGLSGGITCLVLVLGSALLHRWVYNKELVTVSVELLPL